MINEDFPGLQLPKFCYFPHPELQWDLRGDLRSTWAKVGATFVSGITAYKNKRERETEGELKEFDRFALSPPRVLGTDYYLPNNRYLISKWI